MTTTIASCGQGCRPGLENTGTEGWNDWHEIAGANDDESLTTLTIPCTSEIQALQTSVEAWYQASATAAAATAGGSAGAHDAQPYSFPISFPFSATAGSVSEAAAAATTATLTLALTNSSAGRQNASTNGTWSATGVTPSAPSGPGTPAETARVAGSAASPPPSLLLFKGPWLSGAVLLVSLAVSVRYLL